MANILKYLAVVFFMVKLINAATPTSSVESCKDEKELKNLLKTKPNLLILFSKSSKF
jgi:hypothetical protein